MIVTAVRCYPPCDMKLFSLLIAFGFLSCVAQAYPIAFCPFCNGERIRGWTSAAHSDFLKSTYNPFPDAPVMSTKHFVAYITKGAFTPHYFLLVSKEHFERIADLPEEYLRDLEELKRFFENYYRDVLQTEFVSFEHGALSGCHAGGGKGGCIDHLHLHMLPFKRGDLRSSVEREYQGELGKPHHLNNLSELSRDEIRKHSYLFLQESSGEMFAFPVVGEIPSQLMRKIISTKIGRGDQWNWREFVNEGDFLVNSAVTFHALALYRELGAEEAAKRMICESLLITE